MALRTPPLPLDSLRKPRIYWSSLVRLWVCTSGSTTGFSNCLDNTAREAFRQWEFWQNWVTSEAARRSFARC